ncbi:MAG: peptide deformylase [Lachnospiraceae bacterium]|nr:peptide deformylase [Lachnospiraceae bacterium]
MIKEILTLGDPRLYDISAPITEADRADVPGWVTDLHDTLMAYREKYGAGRAVAAPQIGVFKRLLYAYMDRPYVFINPVLTFPDDETYVLLDDCMSFPGLMVRVERHRRADIAYLDENFTPRTLRLEGDFSELIQHEYDHLDGILATMRAVDNKSFILGQMKRDFG